MSPTQFLLTQSLHQHKIGTDCLYCTVPVATILTWQLQSKQRGAVWIYLSFISFVFLYLLCFSLYSNILAMLAHSLFFCVLRYSFLQTVFLFLFSSYSFLHTGTLVLLCALIFFLARLVFCVFWYSGVLALSVFS